MTAMFGFMDYLIIIKWMTNFQDNSDKAPSIITTMITMALSMGTPAASNHQYPLVGAHAEQGDWST